MNTIHRHIAYRAKTFIGFLIVTIFLFGCTNSADQAVATAPLVLPISIVNESSETTFSEYPASIHGAVDIEVRPQVSGYIQRVLVNEGAFVSAGQTLFIINPQPYEEALNNARANLHAAEAAILNAQLEIDKYTPLVQNKVVSDFQLKTAKTAYKIAQASAEQAKAGVASAEINLGYTRIKASVSGYIGLIPKKQGSLVAPSDPTPLTQLSDSRHVHVYFALAEKDFIAFNSHYQGNSPSERLKHLPPVELVLADNSIYPIKGVIDMINGQFDKNTAAITFRASFANSHGNLRSGNTGKLRLGLKHDHAIPVPQSATVEMQDKIFVFTLGKDNTVNKTPVAVIAKSGTNYLVSNGLKSGDQIVLSGLDRLQEGQLIQPQKTSDITAQINNKQ